MPSRKTIGGDMTQGDVPDWAPLEAVGFDLVGGFMWMFEVRLADGTQLQAYKHRMTRRYAHLDDRGRAFAFTRDGRYRELVAPDPYHEPATWAVLTAAGWRPPEHERGA